MEVLVSCRSLSCGYAGRLVLQDIDVELQRGEILVLLGPNGSGKSTFLKTVIGAIRPLSGVIELGGKDAKNLGARETAQLVAFVPQEEHAPFPFTGRQIVLMGRLARSRRLADSEEDVQAAEAAMEAADVTGFADRPITELSGGERQRLLIARALASEAPTLLLDEPTSHLDAAHVVGLVGLLRRLAKEGRGIVAAVHDLNIAAELGDRAILLGSGKVQAAGPVEDVLMSPELEAVYGIGFDRMRDRHGRLRVFPHSLG